MKKMIAAAGLLMCLLSFAAPFKLAENGKTEYKIVLPDQPEGFDRQAAEDLKNYLGKMTGAEFRIVPESKAAGNKLIYVGQTAFAKKHNRDFAKLGAEEWVIRPVGNSLILSGGKPIGSFYAVWNVLNRLGCYSLTWDQDAVPSYNVLTADIPEEQKKPVFEGRWVSDGFAWVLKRTKADPSVMAAYRLFKLRSGMNGRIRKEDGLWTYGSFHYNQFPPFHSLCYLYVPRKLFDTHPEYFSMNELCKRFRPRTSVVGGSVCMSNPAVAEVALDSLRKMIRKERAELPREQWATVYDISALDDSPYICKCPECTAVSKEEGSETGLMLRFINRIAAEIRKEYPDVIIRTFGYSSTVNPPTKTLPADNVLIQLCDKFTVSDPFRPLTDPINADRLPYFREWKKTTKRLMVWDYWNLAGPYYIPPRPDTVFDAIQTDFKFFRDLGISGIYAQASASEFAPQSFIQLSHFVGAQLMMDPDKNPEKLADIYLKHYYGPAAPRMKKLFNDIRAGMKIQKNRQNSAVVAHWEYLTPKFMYQAYSDLKKLSASLPENSVWRRRVDAERINFTWYALAKRYVYGKVFREHGIDINDLLPECRQLAKAYIRRYPSRRPEAMDERFERTFRPIALNLPRPDKFKDVPDENFRMIAWPHFLPKGKSCTGIVDDPDSIQGKAVRSNRPESAYHGVGWLPQAKKGQPKFQITQFRWGNHKAPGKVSLTIKEFPKDEKYHWYRMPGKLELKPISYFSGHGWAFQAETSHLFTLTDGNPLDNTWDEIWFSAKFTGPAYVKGSKKENAIFVDMAVLIRNRELKRRSKPEPKNKKMKLITLGTGAGNPSMTRHNSCSFLATSQWAYLIDAGGPVSASIIRKGLDFNLIRAVFITHMHEDHFGGLTGFLKNRMIPNGPYNRADRWRGFWPEVWLPDPEAPEAFDRLMAVQFRGEQRDRIKYRVIQPGLFYDDGFLKVTAIPNRHFEWKGQYLPSYCFLFEAEGKKLLCTGDLSADFSDFPVEAAKDADLVLCEFTHFDPGNCRNLLGKIRPGKLVFNHVAIRNEAVFPEFSKNFDYPMFVAKDGDEFEF